MKVLGYFIGKVEENGLLGLNKYKIRTNNGRLRSKVQIAPKKANDMSFRSNDMHQARDGLEQLAGVRSMVGIEPGQRDLFRKHANPQQGRVRLAGPPTTMSEEGEPLTLCHVSHCQFPACASSPSDQLRQHPIRARERATCHT